MRFAVIVVSGPVLVQASVDFEATGRLPVTKHLDDERIRDRIDQAFVVRAALADAVPLAQVKLTVTALAIRLLSAEFTMTAEESAEIRRDPKLRDAWEFLNRSQALCALPSVVAAATGGLTERPFENGKVSIFPSPRPGFQCVKLVWQPRPLPRLLMLEHIDGPPLTRTLPAYRPSDDFLLMCDERSAPDKHFLKWLADPRTTGWFKP
jgi:hypothetical protein